MKMRQFFLNFPQHRERERARREAGSEIGVRARQVLIKISTTARFDLVDGNSWKSLCKRKKKSEREGVGERAGMQSATWRRLATGIKGIFPGDVLSAYLPRLSFPHYSCPPPVLLFYFIFFFLHFWAHASCRLQAWLLQLVSYYSHT